MQGVHYVEVERFADGSWLLGAIENGDLLNGPREELRETLAR
jgi:hypothetical protein